jgi:hypothetical protein
MICKMAHAHFMLDNESYRHTLRICNTAFPWQQWLCERASILRLYFMPDESLRLVI